MITQKKKSISGQGNFLFFQDLVKIKIRIEIQGIIFPLLGIALYVQIMVIRIGFFFGVIQSRLVVHNNRGSSFQDPDETNYIRWSIKAAIGFEVTRHKIQHLESMLVTRESGT